jgi:hypothetical protein
MTFVTQHPSSFGRHLEKAINRKSRVLPAGAGKPWDAEDQSFISDFENGTSIAELANSRR